jgi:long-subunit fatty acid transport protein
VVRFVTVVLISLLSINVHAAYSNYNSMLVGNQAAGMGGAYTALSKDSSALAFYNPASLAFATDSSASASASVYKKFDTQYGSVEQFSTASLRVNQGFFRGVPSASGSVLTYEKLNASFSIVVPDYDTFGGEIRSTETSVSLLSGSEAESAFSFRKLMRAGILIRRLAPLFTTRQETTPAPYVNEL